MNRTKACTLVTLSLLLVGCGDGVFTIKGHVVDETGAIVPGAKVTLSGVNDDIEGESALSSRESGEFFFEQVCAPNRGGNRLIRLQCSRSGFVEYDEKVRVSDTTTQIKIVLTRQVENLVSP